MVSSYTTNVLYAHAFYSVLDEIIWLRQELLVQVKHMDILIRCARKAILMRDHGLYFFSEIKETHQLLIPFTHYLGSESFTQLQKEVSLICNMKEAFECYSNL